MKPLYLIHSNEDKLYHSMARRFCKQVKELDAGPVFHLVLKDPGRGRSYFGEAYATLYPFISKAIDEQPVIVVDADHILKKPIIGLFDDDWDIAAVYRGPSPTEHGRQDYCAGSVFLNNKRPNLIRKFWIEWTHKTWTADSIPAGFPDSLLNKDWRQTWMEDQAALNEMILSSVDNTVKIGHIHEVNHRLILPLANHLYGKGSIGPERFMRHIKGFHKRRKKWVKV